MKALGIYYANQCDKAKCTSIKIYSNKQKLSFPVFLFTKKFNIRLRSLVLTPNGSILLPADHDVIAKMGLTVLDCSWKQNDSILSSFFPFGRKLPKLLAGNPVNYGRWDFLTSMEACFSALFITNFEKEAFEILNLLSWGKTFLDLNYELLMAYKTVKNESEYLTIYEEFFK